MIVGLDDRPRDALVHVAAFHVAGARIYPAGAIVHAAHHALRGGNVLDAWYVRPDGLDLRINGQARR